MLLQVEVMAVCEDKKQDTRIQRIASSIRVVPDFPKKGRTFPCKSKLRFNAFSIALSLPFHASLHFYAAVSSYRPLFFLLLSWFRSFSCHRMAFVPSFPIKNLIFMSLLSGEHYPAPSLIRLISLTAYLCSLFRRL